MRPGDWICAGCSNHAPGAASNGHWGDRSEEQRDGGFKVVGKERTNEFHARDPQSNEDLKRKGRMFWWYDGNGSTNLMGRGGGGWSPEMFRSLFSVSENPIKG